MTICCVLFLWFERRTCGDQMPTCLNQSRNDAAHGWRLLIDIKWSTLCGDNWLGAYPSTSNVHTDGFAWLVGAVNLWQTRGPKCKEHFWKFAFFESKLFVTPAFENGSSPISLRIGPLPPTYLAMMSCVSKNGLEQPPRLTEHANAKLHILDETPSFMWQGKWLEHTILFYFIFFFCLPCGY